MAGRRVVGTSQGSACRLQIFSALLATSLSDRTGRSPTVKSTAAVSQRPAAAATAGSGFCFAESFLSHEFGTRSICARVLGLVSGLSGWLGAVGALASGGAPLLVEVTN